MYNKQDMQKLVQSLNEFDAALDEMTPEELKLLAETAVESVDSVLGSEQDARLHARYLSGVLWAAKAAAHEAFQCELERVMHPQWKPLFA